ncbi:hypothetical protein V8F20_006134 [Naviculisporaceae sp. PSN 640]
MQGRLLFSLGLLSLANCQQQQPAMALERRDICLVSCGEGWCCVSGQKCVAGPSKDFSTPYGCEDEILGFHTTWEAYRGDFKEWTSTTYIPKPEPTPAEPPADIISRSTTTTTYDVVVTPSLAPPHPPPPHYSASSEAASTTAIVSYPVDEPETSSSSMSSSPAYIETSYPSYPESSSSPSIITYSTSYSNSTTSLQAPLSSDAANTITPPSSTPTSSAPQPAQTTVVPASAGRLSVGNTIATVGFLATFMGFLMA